MTSSFFDKLTWRSDRMLLGDLVFRLEHAKNAGWELGDSNFIFFKTQSLVDQYARFWASHPDFQARNIFELGLWDGGSVAFWFECFQPQKHVAIDFSQRGDSGYFKQYVEKNGLRDRISTHWAVNQANASQLRALVRNEFDGPLDLVVDDASHLYAPTKSSFETLFPHLRPGGLFIIEDWAWSHWREFHAPNHPWATETPLTRLINDLVAATGSTTELIANLSVYQGFTVVERGAANLDTSGGFRLVDFIVNRPRPNPLRWAVRTGRKRLRQLRGRN